MFAHRRYCNFTVGGSVRGALAEVGRMTAGAEDIRRRKLEELTSVGILQIQSKVN